ncbi:MAG: hypothetical protein RBT16_02170 [Desulfococcus multivorans]|jgi:hypothetical protein|nr:hypothetical protein [Desulfococcus multivorans]
MARAEIPVDAVADMIDVNNDRQVLHWVIDRIEKKHPASQSCRKDAENTGGFPP